MLNSIETRETYILRRAAWIGNVNRQDMCRAFDISPNLASKDLTDVSTQYPQFLKRNGRLGVKFIGIDLPKKASAVNLLKLLERGAEEWETGLRNEEFAVLLNPLPIYRTSECVSEIIIKACIQKVEIKISYIGLRQGEFLKSRIVLPLGLEFTGRQWRLIAQESGSSIQKTFVMARIADASFLPKSNASKESQNILTDLKRYRVTVNNLFTPDQVKAIEREFDIKSESIVIGSRNIFEFKKLFCLPSSTDKLSDAVWPIFSTIEEDKR